jgi:hypothetical protein
VKYVDPNGEKIQAAFYVTSVVKNSTGGTTAMGHMVVYNTTTKNYFLIFDVKSGGTISGNQTSSSKHIPFGTYDILGSTKKGKFYMRLEACDNHYGDDKANFPGQEEHSLLRFHNVGSGTTIGCVSVPDEDAGKIEIELRNTSTFSVLVETKYTRWFAQKLKPYEFEKKYGELKVIDTTDRLQIYGI